MPLLYHAGQVEVQEEANTRRVADMLSSWVGPVGDFTLGADLVILAALVSGDVRFVALSGRPPLVDVAGGAVVLPLKAADFGLTESSSILAGGIAINLGQRRRARLNGALAFDEDGGTLEAFEAFTNCRKYMAPSLALEDDLYVGPQARLSLDTGDAWLAGLLSRAETAFLASFSPLGQPDVSHRGGPPGFLNLDVASGRLSWPEYVGDGMLKSAGNVRAAKQLSLLVCDLETGDAAQLDGNGIYTSRRRAARPRSEGLEQHKEQFPVQGEMQVEIRQAFRLQKVASPRRRIEKALKITSASSTDEQAPQ